MAGAFHYSRWFHHTTSSLYWRMTIYALVYPMVLWCLALTFIQLTAMLYKFCVHSVKVRLSEVFQKASKNVCVTVYWVTFIIRAYTFHQQIVTHSLENRGSNWDCTLLSAWSMKLLHFLQEICVMHHTPQAFTAPGYLVQRVQYMQRKTQSFCDGMLITN